MQQITWGSNKIFYTIPSGKYWKFGIHLVSSTLAHRVSTPLPPMLLERPAVTQRAKQWSGI